MYFKLLETFVLKILFSKDEYNIASKHFNPLRFFVITLLVLNVFFTVYLLSRLNTIYQRVHLMCPTALHEPVTTPTTLPASSASQPTTTVSETKK